MDDGTGMDAAEGLWTHWIVGDSLKRLFPLGETFAAELQAAVAHTQRAAAAPSAPVAMEVASLAPNSQVSTYPWKEPKDRIPGAVRHIRDFLRAHAPVAAAR